MAVPSWILESPLRLGLQTMVQGAQTGLSARHADLAQREQDLREEQATVHDQLAQEQFEQQKQHAADALRAQSSMASARLALAASQMAERAGYHKEAMAQKKAADALREKHLGTMEDIAGKRLDLAVKKAAPFDPTQIADIPVPGPTGEAIAIKTPLGPNRWQAIPIKNPKSQDLTPYQKISSQLKIAAPNTLGSADTTDPLYNQRTNALQQAISMLSAPMAPQMQSKPLTAPIAVDFLKQAGGDKEKARKLARDAGYAF